LFPKPAFRKYACVILCFC